MTADCNNVRYQYTPLPSVSGFFRLLEIQSPTVEHDGGSLPLRGSLVTCESGRRPEYVALSYVWGSKDTNSPTISIDGHHLSVTENCYQALLSLQQTLGSYTIWVDAICIDQHNETEQAHQIAQMTDIYAGATKVYIWLGQGSLATGRAMACLEAVAFPASLCTTAPRWNLLARFWIHWRKNFAALTWEMPGVYIALCEVIRTRSLRVLLGEYPHPEFLKGHKFQREHKVELAEIDEVLSSTWLDRIWTYQEVMLSRCPVLVAGQVQSEWNKFSLGVITLESVLSRAKDERQILLDKWLGIIVDREKFQVTLNDNSFAPEALEGNHQNLMSDYRELLQSFKRRFYYPYYALASVITIVMMTWAQEASSWSSVEGTVLAFGGLILLLFLILMYFSGTDPTLKRIHRHHGKISGLLSAVLTRKASVRKDYNRGVRSLLEILLGRKLPVIDASFTNATAYHDLTVHALEATKCGDILVSAAIRHAKNLPSWAPDWSRKWPQPFNVLAYSGDDMAYHDGASLWRSSGNIRSWHQQGATRGSSLQYRYDQDRPKTLHVRGVEIAKITTVYPCYSDLTVKEKITLLDRLISKMLRHSGRRIHIKVLGGTDSLFYPKLCREKRMLERYFKSVERDPEKQQDKPPETPSLDRLENSSCPSYFGAGWRHIIVADPGKPEEVWDTGIAMDRVQVGDRIFLLSGVPAPLVLRACEEGGYRLISPVRKLDRAMTGKYWHEREGFEYPFVELH